ncbi:MAG: hypothetical protein SF182_02620 [Deltaproteobacteria bacterium]|nr:hypothetical protein [Deltaproteobacteria bacterium]
MAAGPRERIASLIKDVEKSARQLRNDIRKRAAAAPKNLEAVSGQLRKGAADIAKQVEQYVREVRVSLEGKPAAAKKPAKRATAPKRKKVVRRRTRA